MLTRLDDDDDEQRVLLGDFGIARNVDDISGLTATNMTMGTVAYAAPEQLMGLDIDGRADQYALAATAYHLLAGSLLFPHSNPAVVISRHLNATPPDLSDTKPKLASLDAPLRRALSKNPNDRFSRCQDMARALASGSGVKMTEVLPDDSAPTQAAPAREVKHDTANRPSIAKAPQRRLISISALVLAVLVLAVVGAVILDRVWHNPTPKPSPPIATAPPTLSTTTASPPPPTTTAPTPTSASTTTTTMVTTPPTHALPVAVVGSSCRLGSTPTVDPDGATVYCARIQYTDAYLICAHALA
jgi:serine/threonine protein kinase, bacterial